MEKLIILFKRYLNQNLFAKTPPRNICESKLNILNKYINYHSLKKGLWEKEY